MHRHASVSLVAALLCSSLAVAHVTAASSPGRRLADRPAVVSACGVERWAVKTGTDPDARLVNQRVVVPTNIIHLRSLPPPAVLPPHARIKPVETTVWSVDALLLRYKQETDSDYHLVLSDTGGRTMIAEIPAPECVGSSSPFLPAMRAVRKAFTARFQPTTSFRRLRLKIHIVGVGFFDFEHGQSGVSDNAIELHPVLSISWAGTTSAPSAATPVLGIATPVPAGTASTGPASLTPRVRVSPNPTSDGTLTTVSAVTLPGALCTVRILYASGHSSRSATLATSQTAEGAGQVSWQWRPATSVPGPATATVGCTRGGTTATTTATFTVR